RSAFRALRSGTTPTGSHATYGIPWVYRSPLGEPPLRLRGGPTAQWPDCAAARRLDGAVARLRSGPTARRPRALDGPGGSGSDRAAGHRGRGARVGGGVGLAGEVFLDAEPVVVGALGDGHQRVPVGDLLDLLAQEPEHELLAPRIGLGARGPEQCLDPPGDLILLLKRERARGRGPVALGPARRPGGDGGGDVPVEHVLDHHHGVVPLAQAVLVGAGGQLRQVLRVRPHGDRDVLLAGGELVADLPGEEFGVGAAALGHGGAFRETASTSAETYREGFSRGVPQ